MSAKPKVIIHTDLPGLKESGLYDFAEVEVIGAKETLDTLPENSRSADAALVLLTDPVGDAFFQSAPQLKVVANYAVGFNNVDLDEAKKRGIWVTNTPDVLTDATADIAFGLILSVTRRFHEAEDDLRAGGFLGWAPDYMLGRSLRGKTLGLLGFGRIGQATARRAAAFGMKIRFYSPSPKSLKSFGSTDIAAASFDEIIEQSDVLSLHLPLSAATHHLLNRQALFAMKKGAFLINTSRGPLVDEGALAEALHEGHLGGAGLDVFEKEPLVHERLLSAPRATLLPHIGSADIETRRAMTQLAVDNIIAILEGREPLTPVFKLSGEENE